MKRFVYAFVMIILAGIFAFSAYKIYEIQSEYKQGEDTYSDISTDVVVEVNEPTASSETEAKSEIPVQINFTKLKNVNSDIIGWIYNAGTVINYPVVQGKDNDYYLNHLITGKYNSSGTPFLDANIKSDFSEKHSIIYAHHMKNGSMFSSITNYKNSDYYNKHKNMYLMTPTKNYRLEVFSAYVTPADSDTYMRGFGENEEYENYIKNITSKSIVNTGVVVAKEDRIVSLSTCSYEYENARFIVHCRTVEIQ